MDVKFRVPIKGGRNVLIPGKIIAEGGRLYLSFKFSRYLISEIKSMDGARWHGYEDPPRKIWSIKDSGRNHFQLDYLTGGNPYARYDKELVTVISKRPLYSQQFEMEAHVLTRRHCIIAGEMGTCKTLAIIEIMEKIKIQDWWYIAPRSALRGVEYDYKKWNAQIIPEFMTYERMRKRMDEWQPGTLAPQGVIFDESSKIKTATAKRSEAALTLAEGIREDWGDKGYIVLMTGTPAPKSPADWWHQCEVACPGFLKEGNWHKFQRRLAVIEDRENQTTGGIYPHLVAWRDSELRCEKCGLYEDDEKHNFDNCGFDWYHEFKEGVNEVALLHKRMKGLVYVVFKKDCMDLPDKIYEKIIMEPSTEMLRAAQLIAKRVPRTASALILLRELSDGFQYIEEEIGYEICPQCKGKKHIKIQIPVEEDFDFTITTDIDKPLPMKSITVICDNCGGTGESIKTKRKADYVVCPKEDQLRDDLDANSDIGRIVIYGGFTGTIERIINFCHRQGWATIRVDGVKAGEFRGADGSVIRGENYVEVFLDKLEEYKKVAFIAQPGAGGMGLTLTSASQIIFYSNDFNGESRTQAEDRIHRPGMDYQRGAKITDYFHLPTDKLVFDNLKAKRELETVSMGQIREALSDG